MQKHIAVWGSHWSDPFALQFLLFECSHTLALFTTASSQAVEVESLSNMLSMDGTHESHAAAIPILKAPSPGGPVEVFEIPDSPGGPVEVEGFEEEEESGPAVDLSRPSSSSPATAKKKEAWQDWKPDWKKFSPQPPQDPEPETKTILIKGKGNRRLDPYEYSPKEVVYEEACRWICSSIKAILQDGEVPYGNSKNPIALRNIIKKLINSNANWDDWTEIANEIDQNKSSSPFFKAVFEELKKQKKV